MTKAPGLICPTTGAVSPAPDRERHGLPDPAQTPAFELVPDRQGDHCGAKGRIIDLQHRLGGVDPAFEFLFQPADIGYEVDSLGVERRLLAGAVGIFEHGLAQNCAETVSRPVHDKVPGEPEIVAPVIGQRRAGEQGKAEQELSHGPNLQFVAPVVKTTFRKGRGHEWDASLG